jgi:hypothetical protein
MYLDGLGHVDLLSLISVTLPGLLVYVCSLVVGPGSEQAKRHVHDISTRPPLLSFLSLPPPPNPPVPLRVCRQIVV